MIEVEKLQFLAPENVQEILWTMKGNGEIQEPQVGIFTGEISFMEPSVKCVKVIKRKR